LALIGAAAMVTSATNTQDCIAKCIAATTSTFQCNSGMRVTCTLYRHHLHRHVLLVRHN
jgi:hypothetical protein